MLIARIRYKLWERRNPDKPWLCPGSVAFCQKILTPSMKALEFGSGRSTRWFAQHVGHLTSIEHHGDWHAIVKKQLDETNLKNVDYRLVPLAHPESVGEKETYDPVPEYIALADRFPDRSLHFVVVDGHYRTHCIRHSIPKIAPGGFLLVDDTNLWPSIETFPIPKNWKVVDNSTNGVKRTVIWQAPAE